MPSARLAALSFTLRARTIALSVLLATQTGCIVNMVARSKANDRVEEFNSHDVNLVARSYAKDAVLFEPNGKTLQGREAIATFYRKLFTLYPDAHEELVDIDVTSVSDGWLVNATWRMTAGHKTGTLHTRSLTISEHGRDVTAKATWTIEPAGLWKDDENSVGRTEAQQRAAEFNRHDVDAVARSFAPDAVLLAPSGKPVQGRDAIAAYMRALFARYPDIHEELTDIDVQQQDAAWLAKASWTLTAAGRTGVLRTQSLSTTLDGHEFTAKATWTVDPAGLWSDDAAPTPASPSAPAPTDAKPATVTLKDGTKITGLLKQVRPGEFVIIDTPDGQERTISWDRVREVGTP